MVKDRILPIIETNTYKTNDMEKCESCNHNDKKKSSGNWVVCKGKNMPLDVILKGTSKDCKNYEPVRKSIT